MTLTRTFFGVIAIVSCTGCTLGMPEPDTSRAKTPLLSDLSDPEHDAISARADTRLF